MIRVVGLTQGGVSDPLASSGLNQSVFSALARRVELAGVLDVSLRGWRRWWNALRSWHPDRDRWRERYDLNVESFLALSELAAGQLADRRSDFDLVLQLRTMYAPGFPPGPWPYALLLDNTYALSDRFYPPWAPLGAAEKRRWIELERRTYLEAAAVFARSSWVRNSLIEDYGVPKEKAIWVGSGCHFESASLPEAKAADDGRTVLFVGKDFERKGVPTLLEAFAMVRRRLPAARLLLVGREARIRQEGVEVVGKVSSRARLREIYDQASVFVLPSRFEPCANVVLEAMAYRLPCVLGSVGGVAEFVLEGESGFVVPPDDPGRLAEGIIALLGDPGRRRAFGERGAQRLRELFTWDHVVDRMLPHLERAAAAAG